MDLFPHISHKLLSDYKDSKKPFFCGDLIAKLTTETLRHGRSSNYCRFWLRTVTAKQEHEERDGFGIAETQLNLISVCNIKPCLAKDGSVGNVPKKKKENYGWWVQFIFQEGSVQSMIPSDVSQWWCAGLSTFCVAGGGGAKHFRLRKNVSCQNKARPPTMVFSGHGWKGRGSIFRIAIQDVLYQNRDCILFLHSILFSFTLFIF